MASSKPGELDEVHNNIKETNNDDGDAVAECWEEKLHVVLGKAVEGGGKAGDVEDTPDDRPDSKTSAAEKRSHDVDDPHHDEQEGGVPDRFRCCSVARL